MKLLMLAELKTNGGPSRTVLSAPTVNVPSLPALNVWPWGAGAACGRAGVLFGLVA